MIRELHQGLGIPYDVLVQEQSSTPIGNIDFAKVPVREMASRGWITATAQALRSDPEKLARAFFSSLPGPIPIAGLLRQGAGQVKGSETERTSIVAWLGQATRLALGQPFLEKLARDRITNRFMNMVARTSVEARGPLVVRELLAQVGIVLVILPHLSRTRLDGAAFIDPRGVGVIAMTLRYDRIDYFWHTLLHELVHLARHQNGDQLFIDDLDIQIGRDAMEDEADSLARESVVPRQVWARSDAARLKTASAVLSLANDHGVHPALVAGRLRYETKNFRLLSSLVGQGQIRALFSDETKA